MMIPDHPDEERLSALASRDDDAIADERLTSHVSTCDQCTEVVNELGALRASLADLPDLAPHRPLQLLPPVADAPAAGGVGGWARRLFAPALTAGAAIAMVGLVGTASPILQGGASGQAPFMAGQDAAQEAAAESLQQRILTSAAAAPAAGGEDSTGESSEASPDELDGRISAERESASPEEELAHRPADSAGSDEERQLPAERSPWPMVLFTGIALMVAAALLRWILVPRAG
jgi:hypothetical protein